MEFMRGRAETLYSLELYYVILCEGCHRHRTRHEWLLQFIREQGVTIVHAMPGRANVIAGQTGIFRTQGRTVEEMSLRFPAGLLVNLGEIPKSSYPG